MSIFITVDGKVCVQGTSLLELIQNDITTEITNFTWERNLSDDVQTDIDLDIDISHEYEVEGEISLSLDEVLKSLPKHLENETAKILLNNVSTENIILYLKSIKVLVPQKRSLFKKIFGLDSFWLVLYK